MNRRDFLRFMIGGAAGWALGAGALKARPGAYQIASNWDGRGGIPGPREVADLTGIASGFRVIKILKHADTNVAIATNGTTTRVYRKETTWVSKVDQLDGGGSSEDAITGVATDAISFKNVLAIALGGSAAYVYTSATTATGRTWDFTTSTKTAGNAERANYFLEQSNGLLTPRVMYCVNPNESYYTEDLTNTDGAGVNPSYIGDSASTQNYFTSIAEEPGTGRVLFGMRHALYTLHQEPGYDGIWERLTENFPDAISDAGGQSDRLNFENPALVGGTLYYPVQGYDILAWRPGGAYDRFMSPRWTNDCKLPRMDLPINALVSAGGYLIAFLGSKNTASLKDVTYFPGGSAHLAATFTTASEMWVGVPTSGQMVWHGVLLECTNPLRYAFYDEDDSYITLCSGDSESADLQTTRCLFTVDNPLNRLTSSAVVLNAGTWQVEPGAIDFDDDWMHKRAEHLRVQALGLNSSAPSIEVEYKATPDYDTTAFSSEFAIFTDEETAMLGAEFPDETLFRKLHLRFRGVGTGNTYAVLQAAEVRATWASEMDQAARRR